MGGRASRRAIREINQRQRREAARGLKELAICIEKTAYASEEQALDAVGAVLTRGTTATRPMQVYRCSVCSRWHLTKGGS